MLGEGCNAVFSNGNCVMCALQVEHKKKKNMVDMVTCVALIKRVIGNIIQEICCFKYHLNITPHIKLPVQRLFFFVHSK